MGAEARTTLSLGRQTFAGTAHLESSELSFLGETRVKIPLASISSVDVRKGSLHITHAEGVAIFSLGDVVSGRWAEKIRSPRTLAEKLGVKKGMQVAVVGVEDETLLADLVARGATLTHGEVPTGTQLVLWRVARASFLCKLAGMTGKIARDGAIWVIHPRGDASIADTVIFAAGRAAGLTATKVVRFSETDTAEKLVIPRSQR